MEIITKALLVGGTGAPLDRKPQVVNLGELILAASDEARKLNIVLLDEPSEKMLKMSKSLRKEKEVAERTSREEIVIDVPPGKRVRIVLTGEHKASRSK